MLQHFGDPTDEEKRIFTRVLQGHIAIDVAVFPNGTTGLFLCACFLNIAKGLSALQDT